MQMLLQRLVEKAPNYAHQSTFAPLAVNLKVAPSISAAPRHISIRCRKISKYSYMLQMSVSICRFSEMTFDCKIISRRPQSNCGKICVTVRNIALELHMDLNQCHKLAAQNQFDRVVPYHSPEIRCQRSFEL